MSTRERRNRKDRRAKTPAELHHRRCGICMESIKHDEPTRPVPGGSGQAHEVCPVWAGEIGRIGTLWHQAVRDTFPWGPF